MALYSGRCVLSRSNSSSSGIGSGIGNGSSSSSSSSSGGGGGGSVVVTYRRRIWRCTVDAVSQRVATVPSVIVSLLCSCS